MRTFKTIENHYLDSTAEELTTDHRIEFKQFTLDNGLKCILYRDNKNPIIDVSLGYDAGSKDERPNKKGIAHLFEHLMFQGSENLGKSEHFSYIQRAGGSCNAFTMQDLTAYYDLIPSNHLETALWLESDRMNSLDLTEDNLQNQKDVVIEEKSQRYDNAPYGTAMHNIFKHILKGSYYETPVIGYTEDIKSFTLEEAIEFHTTYYSPKNSTMVVSGDIEYHKTEDLIRKYFSDIKNGKEIVRKEKHIPEFTESYNETVYDNIHLPAIYIAYRIPASGNKDDYTLDYFSSVLANDKSSRLYKKLVYEMKIAKSVHVNKYQLRDAGIFIIKAEAIAIKDIEKIKETITEEIQSIAEKGITEYEFNKVRNEIEFYNIIKNLTLQKISIETLFNHILFKDTELINNRVKKYLEIEMEDIRGSVSNYFPGKSNLILTYLPK